MPNITPEQIVDAIAEILEAEGTQGIVVTDKKLAKSNQDLSRLLKGQSDVDEWRGWVFTWAGIASQTDEGDCITETSYHFIAKFFHFYLNDYKENLTTEMSFKRAVFNANEALNAKRHLGFKNNGQPVRHQGLQSEGDFDVEDIGGGSVSQPCHTAEFTFDVTVTNTY